MRFVPVKSEEQQSHGMLFRTRELLVGQRTQIVNALRGHLAEYGFVVAQGIGNMRRLAEIIDDGSNNLLDLVRETGRIYLEECVTLSRRITSLQRQIEALSKKDETTRRLRTIPGIGPICAMAVETFAPPMKHFRRGRDFAAWLGLVPRQHSTGGKQKLGRTSKMGQRDIRRLLIVGAMSVVQWSARRGAPEGSWIARLLARKPRMIVAIALANKMARTIWAVQSHGEDYRNPTVAVA
jgi:transposase